MNACDNVIRCYCYSKFGWVKKIYHGHTRMFSFSKNYRRLLCVIIVCVITYLAFVNKIYQPISSSYSSSGHTKNTVSKTLDFKDKFLLDYHSILTQYPEVIIETKDNAKCLTKKILFNNTFAKNMSEEFNSSFFKCNNLPPNEYVVEIQDIYDDSSKTFWRKWMFGFQEDFSSYQLHLRVENLKKLYNNTFLDPAKITCYAEKFEKAEGKNEYYPGSLRMSTVKAYFDSSNDYKIVVNQHG
jgi:hypothetical protein